MDARPFTTRSIAETVVVVGAAGPRGAAVARAAATAGARVLLIGDDEAALGEAVRAINNAGGVSDYAVAPDGHRQALAAAGRVARARFGPVDAWIDAAADSRERIDATRAAASPLIDREGGVLILVVPPGIALDADREGGAPTLSLLTAATDVDPDTVAAAVLRRLERPRPAMTIRSTGRARRRGGAIAALGLGGLAIAAGAVALLRRNARRRR